jgi:hypothetical protein
MSKYETIRKKYKTLPSLKWVKKNFDVEEDTLEGVRKAIAKRLKTIAEYFETLLLGESYKTFVERSFLSEEQKEEVSKIYKNIQVLLSKEMLLKLERNREMEVKWIIEAKELWEKVKPSLYKIFETIADGWKKYEVRFRKETKYHW